jgi:hypothetical protein
VRDDLVGGFGPDEWLATLVPCVDEGSIASIRSRTLLKVPRRMAWTRPSVVTRRAEWDRHPAWRVCPAESAAARGSRCAPSPIDSGKQWTSAVEIVVLSAVQQFLSKLLGVSPSDGLAWKAAAGGVGDPNRGEQISGTNNLPRADIPGDLSQCRTGRGGLAFGCSLWPMVAGSSATLWCSSEVGVVKPAIPGPLVGCSLSTEVVAGSAWESEVELADDGSSVARPNADAAMMRTSRVRWAGTAAGGYRSKMRIEHVITLMMRGHLARDA